jgi:hypothetical protein
MAGFVAAAQAQFFQYRESERGIKEDGFPVQRFSSVAQKSAQSNTMLPLEGLYYYGEWTYSSPDTAVGPVSYKYHEDGNLREVYYDAFPHHWGVDAQKEEYNNTFTMDGKNMVDTLTSYEISNGVYTPYTRAFYNYHYYDKFEISHFCNGSRAQRELCLRAGRRR